MSRFRHFLWLVMLLPLSTFAQARKDDIVVRDTAGLGGAQVRVCTSAGSGTPCTPLATVYSDRGMTTTKSNPFSADSRGNYNFYAPPGRYFVQIITGTSTLSMPDVLLPNDPSSGLVTGFSSASYSSTMTFDSALATIYSTTLTGNVTSSSVTNAASGRLLVFDICQDSTGGRTFSWPSNFVDPPQILSGASQCTNETFFYDGSSWRRTNTSDLVLSGTFVPGIATGTITNPATAPTCAVDATSGGSFDNTTRYFRITLVHYYNSAVGETRPSPACTLTPTTLGGGAGTISVNVAGNEWRLGAEGYRVYECSDSSSTSNCHLRTGFNGALTILPNAHYTPGTVILAASDLTNVTAPPLSNTTTIDADQVAYNASCNNFASSAYCYGTTQYRQNPVGGYAQTGLGPLVVAGVGARIQGHAGASVDDTSSGSTRNCAFTTTELGCVMVMNVNGVNIDGLHVRAAGSQGYMLNTWANSFNEIKISNATVITSGTNAVAPLRIKGIWYYLQFPNLQLTANTTGTGANRGAAVLLSNNSGGTWKFSGPVRWTVSDNNDAFRNNLGHSDPDRGISTAFPAMVGDFKVEDVQIQWGTTGTGQGVLLSGGNWIPQFNRVTSSDYAPAAGAPAFIQLGADASAAAACCQQASFSNSSYLSPSANNASWIKMALTASNNSSLTVNNVFATHTNLFDLNNVGLSKLEINMPTNGNNPCNFSGTTNKIINSTATQTVLCTSPVNNGVTASRISNFNVTGGWTITSDGDRTKQRHLFWSGTDNLVFTTGDPTVQANYLWQSISSTGFRFFNTSGSTLLDLNRTNTAVGVGTQADINSALTLPNNRRLAFLNAAGSAFVSGMVLDASDRIVLAGSGNHVIPAADNTTDLGLTATRWRTGYFGTSVVSPFFGTTTASNFGLYYNSGLRLLVDNTLMTTYTPFRPNVTLNDDVGDNNFRYRGGYFSLLQVGNGANFCSTCGPLRLGQLGAISWRNNGNTDDLSIGPNTSDQFDFFKTNSSTLATIHRGGERVIVSTVSSSPQTLADTDYVVLCDANGGAITINLPATSGAHVGRVFIIKKIDSSANACTLDGNASETIDGALTRALTTQYESVTIVSDGSNWYVI